LAAGLTSLAGCPLPVHAAVSRASAAAAATAADRLSCLPGTRPRRPTVVLLMALTSAPAPLESRVTLAGCADYEVISATRSARMATRRRGPHTRGYRSRLQLPKSVQPIPDRHRAQNPRAVRTVTAPRTRVASGPSPSGDQVVTASAGPRGGGQASTVFAEMDKPVAAGRGGADRHTCTGGGMNRWGHEFIEGRRRPRYCSPAG
jgi:hypothetical protein